MPIDISKIRNLLGDRILVRPLKRPEKRGSLMLPVSSVKEKGKQQDLWFGIVVKLGRDAQYPNAYDLEIGDMIGVEFTGAHCETLAGDDGEDYCWVAEEFLACKSGGRVEAHQKNDSWDKTVNGLIPLGSFVLVRPDEEVDTRRGIHIPQSARESQKLGDCLAVSSGEIIGSELRPLHVTQGSKLLFGRYSGQWAKLDEDLLLMKQEDVIAEFADAREVASV